MTDYTNEDLARCAEREATYRKRVYARRVEAGKMTKMLASRQIGMMQAIAVHFRELAEKDRLI